MRKAINTLQAAASFGGVVDEEVVYRALGKVSPTRVRAIITEAVIGDFGKAVKEVVSLIRNEGADPLDIIKIIHREVVSATSQLKVPEELKPKAVYIVSEHHYRLLRDQAVSCRYMDYLPGSGSYFMKVINNFFYGEKGL